MFNKLKVATVFMTIFIFTPLFGCGEKQDKENKNVQVKEKLDCSDRFIGTWDLIIIHDGKGYQKKVEETPLKGQMYVSPNGSASFILGSNDDSKLGSNDDPKTERFTGKIEGTYFIPSDNRSPVELKLDTNTLDFPIRKSEIFRFQRKSCN
ncbi:hypothetical protein HMY34_17690 [Thiothrix subterranea]|uniref:hypothetical protein n=1 Tax=Thiothrix subterranea TaxID=2735563 RepID=UPI00192B6ED6|nr:hypothetical protein [Thiothrix subterranea]QQZ30439.1 hypothetical protein HMY34_17690 [Thiothrix subterranea]